MHLKRPSRLHGGVDQDLRCGYLTAPVRCSTFPQLKLCRRAVHPITDPHMDCSGAVTPMKGRLFTLWPGVFTIQVCQQHMFTAISTPPFMAGDPAELRCRAFNRAVSLI